MQEKDPRFDLPRYAEVEHCGRLCRVLGKEVRPTGKPGLNRVWYRVERARMLRGGGHSWGVYAWRWARATNLTVV